MCLIDVFEKYQNTKLKRETPLNVIQNFKKQAFKYESFGWMDGWMDGRMDR